MSRRVNEFGREKIKAWEGLRLQSYKDGGGVWTIGYGHTSAAGMPAVHKGMFITQVQADEIFERDLAKFEDCVNSTVKVELTDNQFAALVSFCLNVGETAFRKSTLVKKLNKGDYASVPEQLGRWVHDNGKKVPGLVNRRAAECGLWATGAFVTSAGPTEAKPVPVPTVTKETISWGAGILATLASLFEGTGPIQWALAGVIVVSFTVGAYLFLSKRLNPK